MAVKKLLPLNFASTNLVRHGKRQCQDFPGPSRKDMPYEQY